MTAADRPHPPNTVNNHFCRPKDKVAISIRLENCSTRSSRGSSTAPGWIVAPTPNSTLNAVLCSRLIRALSPRAAAKVDSARCSPSSAYWSANWFKGPAQTSPARSAQINLHNTLVHHADSPHQVSDNVSRSRYALHAPRTDPGGGIMPSDR